MSKYVIGKKFSSYARMRGKDRIAQLLSYAGIETNPDIWMGSRLLITFLAGMIGCLLPFSVLPFLSIKDVPLLSGTDLFSRLSSSLLLGAVFALGAALLIYMHLYYLVAERTKRVEKVLPDFLLIVSANLRSGMTPFAAFQAAARPEFGPLQSEILFMSSRSLGTESFTDILRELTVNIDSSMLRRVINFFENEVKSGGKLAHLLETSANEIRETEEVKNQMMVATKSYAIFLAFILVVGLPLLLAISTQFLSVFTKFQANLGSGEETKVAGASMISAPKLTVSVSFIEQMAYTIIFGTSILTSLLIGILAEGKALYGLKYFPPLAFTSLVFFLIFKTVIGGFIGALI